MLDCLIGDCESCPSARNEAVVLVDGRGHLCFACWRGRGELPGQREKFYAESRAQNIGDGDADLVVLRPADAPVFEFGCIVEHAACLKKSALVAWLKRRTGEIERAGFSVRQTKIEDGKASIWRTRAAA